MLKIFPYSQTVDQRLSELGRTRLSTKKNKPGFVPGLFTMVINHWAIDTYQLCQSAQKTANNCDIRPDWHVSECRLLFAYFCFVYTISITLVISSLPGI